MANHMNTYRVLAVGVAGAALLAACNLIPGLGGNRNAANATNNAGQTSAAANATVGLSLGDSGSGMDGGFAPNAAEPPPAPAQEEASGPIPNIRGGRWQQTSTSGGGAPETEAVCLQGGPLRMDVSEQCPAPPPRPGPNGTYVSEMTCNGRLGPVTARVTAAGDFTNHYSMDGHFSLAPTDGSAPRSLDVHMEAVYIGPCQGNEGNQNEGQGEQQGGQPQQNSGGDK